MGWKRQCDGITWRGPSAWYHHKVPKWPGENQPEKMVTRWFRIGARWSDGLKNVLRYIKMPKCHQMGLIWPQVGSTTISFWHTIAGYKKGPEEAPRMHKKLQDGSNRSQEARGQGGGITWGGLSRWYRDIVSNWLEDSRKTQDGWFQKAIKSPEMGRRWRQECPPMPQDAPRRAWEWPQEAKRARRQYHSEIPSQSAKIVWGRFQKTPGWLQEGARQDSR